MQEYQFVDPRNKAELAENIRRGFDLLQTSIKGLSPQEMTEQPPEGGWTIKDHLAHLAIWRRKALADMQERQPWEGMGITQQQYENSDTDGMNALIYLHWRDRPLEDVLDALKGAQEAILYQLDKLKDEALERPYLPGAAPNHLIESIIGNTYEHDREHQGYIGQMLEKRTRRVNHD